MGLPGGDPLSAAPAPLHPCEGGESSRSGGQDPPTGFGVAVRGGCPVSVAPVAAGFSGLDLPRSQVGRC